MRRHHTILLKAACLLMIAYLGLAHTVFGFRHPWMSDVERFLHTWDAMCFRTIPHEVK